MKKFLIYLSTFLFLFGVSVAFGEVFSENFNDGVLDPEWSASGDYEIIPVPGPGGSLGLHMYRVCDDCNGYTEVGTNTNELIYHFGADIYLSSSTSMGADVDLFHHREDGTFILWAGIYLDAEAENIQAFVGLYDSSGQRTDFLGGSLGPYNMDVWYSLSITINDGYVTFGINGNETNLSHELIQQPDSGFCGGRIASVTYDDDGSVDYYVDNLVAYTSTSTTTIDDILDSVEEWTEGEDPDLVGVGEGSSATGRLTAFVNMLNNAKVLFEDGDTTGACDQLEAAYRKCDGESPPPDFVEGDEEVLEELRGMIETLELGCE